ncbi:hypothetical protein D0C36_11300 [Mucilaginibacter conchicola]|uniref:Aerotolerance regulator N-terminal domain-containing protein n=1 Tax=Mucilaginibacter conchicola TaxID=2303333 RepID=A0A372NRY6_9SPHI|nr:BatA domain-containing protein [Mucilaginibacter conchicola]RFZ92026.1 hypothetical protein D0C36_11300 [Mucilaginibacter conchicola]
MGFLSPIWFLALAALTIPLLIHLWNIRPGKTLKVGSISLITEASKTSSSSFKLLHILLLILRCLLLALIAIFLSKPVWEKMISPSKTKGWILIPKENFNETYTKFKPQVDSLTGKGYELHYFNEGFVKRDSTKQQADTASNTNYWGLVKQLERSGQGRPVYIFTPNFKKHFKGSKPTVHLKLKWQTYTQADSVSKWIASAAFTNDGSIKVTDGTSTPQGTTYGSKILKNDGDAVHTVRTQNGRTSISLNGSKDAPVIVDTTTQRIAIYTDNYPLDAKYLKAALDAATAFSGTKTTIKQYNNTAIPLGQTWLFWLSDKPVPSNISTQSKHIFAYADGKPVDVNSWIEPGHIALKKRISSKENDSQVIWTDGFGDAILSYSNSSPASWRGRGGLYTHFNPAWSDLVWSDDFPAMILKLLQQQPASQPNGRDRRIINNHQLQPDIVNYNMPISPLRESGQTDVSGYFWLLLMVVFAAERVLNYNIKQRENG